MVPLCCPQVKGPNVSPGYYRNPQATAEVFDSEMCFNTGDLGLVLEDGTLIVTGRSKNVIVLTNGENVEPEPLEVCARVHACVRVCARAGRRLGIVGQGTTMGIADWLV